MKLWLISQTERTGYDTYDRAVVAAATAEDAAAIHPDGYSRYEPSESDDWPSGWLSWASRAATVHAEYIGEASDGTKAGVICASFNAG